MFCGGGSGNGAPPGPDYVPPECASIAVDRFKELAVVDEALTTDARGSNRAKGAWSFAHLAEQVTPPGMSTSDFVYRWLLTWMSPARVNSFSVDARTQINAKLLCPWLKRTPSNKCDQTCGTCTAHVLDLGEAPFRLLGFANRLDLRETEDLGGAGEGRLVFGMTAGAADDPSSTPMSGSIIFEFKQPTTDGKDAKFWAEKWHALGQIGAFDDTFKAALQALTDSFTQRGALPGAVGGSALNQVRVNEREFEWQWDLREYKLSDTGLQVSATKNSPDVSLYNSQVLSNWILSNRDAIARNQFNTPPNLTGGQSQPLFRLNPPGIDEPLRKQFAEQTCAGCHQLEQTVKDINFHYSPFEQGIAKLSPFLNSPDGQPDELAHRTNSLRRALCGQ